MEDEIEIAQPISIRDAGQGRIHHHSFPIKYSLKYFSINTSEERCYTDHYLLNEQCCFDFAHS